MNIASRKLIGSVAAMLCALGLVLGTAALQPSLFSDPSARWILGETLVGIFGLGGWQVAKQAQIDQLNGAKPESQPE